MSRLSRFRKRQTVTKVLTVGVVLFPGMLLPYTTVSEGLRSIQAALSTETSLKGCIAIVSHLHDDVGCLAVVRQVGSHGNIVDRVILEGRQRVKVHAIETRMDRRLHRSRWAMITILQPESADRPPRDLVECGHWGKWAIEMMDPYVLAEAAFRSASGVLSNVKDLRHDPVALSYWLGTALPIDQEHRRALLAEHSPIYRLRRELQLMKDMTKIYCCHCRMHLGNASDVMTLSDSGPCDVFINHHGFLHELITIKHVQGTTLDDHPVTEHSWFPGYAWTITLCNRCLMHVGWRFTAVLNDLQPRCFWGLSRRQLLFQQQVD